MTALTEVTVSTSGAKTVRSTVAYSVSAFKDIVGATVAEIAFAGRTFAVFAYGKVTAAMRAKLYCGSHFFKAGR